MKAIRLKQTVQYPCSMDDLIDSKSITRVTVYTLEEYGCWPKTAKKLPYIRKCRDGIYDIVIASNEINNEVIRIALKELSKKTKRSYVFVCEQSLEDKMIRYADRLIRASEKRYADKRREYDFSKAKTPKEKARIIKSLIGEIIYEALVYKDAKYLKSLVDRIEEEIKDLIKQ